MRQIIHIILGFVLMMVGSFNAFGSSYDDNKIKTSHVTNVQVYVPTVGCKVIPHPAPGSSLVDCRSWRNSNSYTGRKGFVSNDIDVDAFLVDVYAPNGERRVRRFLHDPPNTLRRYVKNNVDVDPWMLNHRKLRPFLTAGDEVRVVHIRLAGKTRVYEDPALQTQKEGVLGSEVVFERVMDNTDNNSMDGKINDNVVMDSTNNSTDDKTSDNVVMDSTNNSTDDKAGDNVMDNTDSVEEVKRLPRASDYEDWGSKYPGVKTNYYLRGWQDGM